MKNIGIIVLLFIVFAYIKIRNKLILEDIDISKRNLFNKNFYNKILDFSYSFPFKFFVPKGGESDERIRDISNLLKDAGLEDKYNVRSFMAFKAFILMISMIIYLFLVFLKKYSYKINNFLFKSNLSKEEFGFIDTLPLLMVCLFAALLPSLILKIKAKKNITNRNKDIPLLQMFIILMLKSNKTISEIIYMMSTLNTSHKNTFKVGYRIYTRDPNKGFEYMRNKFGNKKFQETFDILEDTENYSREESIIILQNNMESIVNEFHDTKRRNDLTSLLYSQVSMAVPFLSVIIFLMVPIIVFAISLLVEVGTIA